MTVYVDQKIWEEFVKFVIEKHGTTRRISEEVEKLMADFLRSRL